MPYEYGFQVYLGELYTSSGDKITKLICYQCLSKQLIWDSKLCQIIKKLIIKYLINEDEPLKLLPIYDSLYNVLLPLTHLHKTYPSHYDIYHPELNKFELYSGLSLDDMVFEVGIK